MPVYTWPAGVPYPAPTVEQARLNPISLVQGLTPDALRREQLSINDETLFPRYDGLTSGMLPLPTNFANPTQQEFLNWHTYIQIEYLRTHGSSHPVIDGGTSFVVRYASIGGHADQSLNTNVVLSQDGSRVITLNTLQLNELAALTLTEQRALAGLPLFQQIHAAPLGLIPNSTVPDATAVRDRIKGDIDKLISAIELTPDFVAGQQTIFDTQPDQRANLYHYLSIGQLNFIKQRLDSMALFSEQMIAADYKAVFKRFESLNAYMLMSLPLPGGPANLPYSLNTLDNLKSIESAQNILKGTELQLYQLSSLSLEVATTGIFEDRKLDGPGLVFVLQTFESNVSEAEATALTEEMNQLSRLLQDYTAMQKLLNETLNKYDAALFANPDEIQKLGIKGATGAFIGNPGIDTGLLAEDKTIAMFDRTLAYGNNNTFHPLERKNGVTRPTENIVQASGVLYQHSKDVWDRMAINLSEATKILNQDSQLRMDAISKINRTKNRNYDLATGTLTRLSDILLSILN